MEIELQPHRGRRVVLLAIGARLKRQPALELDQVDRRLGRREHAGIAGREMGFARVIETRALTLAVMGGQRVGEAVVPGADGVADALLEHARVDLRARPFLAGR